MSASPGLPLLAFAAVCHFPAVPGWISDRLLFLGVLILGVGDLGYLSIPGTLLS